MNEAPRNEEETGGTAQPRDPLRSTDEERDENELAAQGENDEDEEEIDSEEDTDEDEDPRE